MSKGVPFDFEKRMRVITPSFVESYVRSRVVMDNKKHRFIRHVAVSGTGMCRRRGSYSRYKISAGLLVICLKGVRGEVYPRVVQRVKSLLQHNNETIRLDYESFG